MIQRIFKVAGAMFVCLLVGLAILVAITIMYPGGSCGGTLASGRSVGANSEGWFIRASNTRDTATITTPGHKIVVAPTELIVDGGHYAAIDESVKSVLVTVRKGGISFVADGKAVVQQIK
jgi:hypothetical protein